jgi:hypothetical protein
MWHSLCNRYILKQIKVGKVIKKSIKIFLIVIVVLLALPTSIWLTIQHPKIQTWLVAKTTEALQNKLGTTVRIEKFDYRPFNRILLRNVYIEDFNHDTLISAQSIYASLLGLNRTKNQLNFHRLTLEDAVINFITDSLGNMNLTQLINKLVPPADSLAESDGDGLSIKFRNIRVVNSNFALKSENAEPIEYGINFDDLNLSDLNLDMLNLIITGDTISFTVNELVAKEKSGFSVDRFRSEISFSSRHMNFDKLRLRSQGANLNVPSLQLQYEGWSELGDFLNNVNLIGEIQESVISTQFLSYFVSELKPFDEIFKVDVSFRGPISDFRIRNLHLNISNSTYVTANANLTGLPDINNTFLFIDVKDFSTNSDDIESIRDPKSGKPLISLPDELKTLGQIFFNGSFTGFISDFVAYGTLATDIGDLSMDLSFKPDQNALTGFNGKISTNKLDLGTLIGDDILGKISLTASVNGSTDYDKHLEALTDAKILALEANGYNYTNIELSGNLSSRDFVGSLFLDDPNAKLNFIGKIDFTDSIPVFDFSAFVPKLDLVKLNLNSSDSISQVSFLLTAKFSGSNLDNTKGEIKVVNGFYKNQNGEIKTSDIVITANNTKDSKQVALKSEFAEGELRGKYNYANIFGSIQKMIYLYLPALSENNTRPEITPTGVENPEFNDYIIRLRLRNTRKLTSVLFPSFRIAENTNVFGIYNPDLQTLNLKIKIPEVELSGNIIKDITIDGITNDSSFVASITTPLVDIGGTFIRNIAINATAANDVLKTSIAWDNRSRVKNLGEIKANAKFFHNPSSNKINIDFVPSHFVLNDTTWNINQSQIIIDSTYIGIKGFELHNKQQRLIVQGEIASSPTDYVNIELENIDVSNLNLYTKSLGYAFEGTVNGYARVTNVTNNPLFYADLTVEMLSANEFSLGDLSFNTQWHTEDKRLSVDLVNRLESRQVLNVAGDFFPDTQNIQFLARINNLALGLFEPLLEGDVVDLKGTIGGNVTITGTADKPMLNGPLRLQDASCLIDFSRTRYFMSDQILLQNSNILFNGFRINDSNNRVATVNGAVNTDFFKNISFDLNVAPSNFQFLNTTERDNELFYGTVFASGQARVTGTPSDILINASVKTEPRTALFLPLSSSSDVAEFDFVNFVNKSDEIIIIEDFFGIEETTSSNIRLTLDLEVTPEADVQIIIDKQLGDIIRANGSGNLKMEIDLKRDIFNMFGQYVIEKGDYLFTLQGVINKRFRIGEGSTITWNGDIEDALMDIKAIYSLRTSLKNLNPTSEDPVYNSRTQVDCEINLSGKLMEPSIDFNIKVPIAESDPNVKAVVQDALSTEEKVSMHFLMLLVINSFASDQEQGAGSVGQGLATTAGEMLSNQLSNWMSQWTSAVDIGVNWRPGDEISSNEIELALSTQLFNDRVTINSNVDMGNQNVSSGIAGDFSIDVKIVPSGKLRVKAFARSNDDIIYGTNAGEITTGAGLMYREDFNTFHELFSRYKGIFSRKKEPEPEFNFVELDNSASINPPGNNMETISQNPFIEIK